MEKYIAFMLGKHMVIIDSFQFMSSSLVLSNLPDESFKYTKSELKEMYYHNKWIFAASFVSVPAPSWEISGYPGH